MNYNKAIKTIFTKDSTNADLTKIKTLPLDYKDLMQQNKSFTFTLSDTNNRHFDIWGLSGTGGALEMNEAFDIQNTFGENVFAIGSDGGDRLLIYIQKNKSNKLYIIEDYEFELDEAIFLSNSLTELLQDGKNINLIL